ncbi:MAG TPA: hypothetical protein VM925_13160, partial [Labilithrix sp.]|nr:hypothetical protein [Labilithrix sp.]
ISQLRTTPLMVLRMWFRGTGYSGPDSGFFQADDLLDNFFVLSRFQREFREVNGFTVVECHIGDCTGIDVREDDHVLRDAARCLERYFPQLGPDALDVGRSRVLRHREGFTLFAPGDASRAPTVAAGDRENLLFAGDWVRSDVRSWFMERAAVTGIEAANHVLARQGYAARPLRVPEQVDVVPKLLGLPFRAGDALRQAYRAVVDGADRAVSAGTRSPEARPSAPKSLDAKRPEARPSAPKSLDAKRPEPKPARRSVEYRSGARIAVAERVYGQPLVDLAELLTTADLARVHPFVREFYEDPSAFDVVARLYMAPIVEQLVRGGLPISPLYALGLVAASDAPRKQEYPVRMHIREDDDGRLRWDRFLLIDGAEVPLFTGHVAVVDGCLRESLDGHGTPITIDLRAHADGEGVRFELARATPAWLFAPVRISYTTHPTANGIRTVGTYRHRLLRLDGQIELEGMSRPVDEHVPVHLPPEAESSVRLLPDGVSPEDLRRRRGA